jgi:hypothetical protein
MSSGNPQSVAVISRRELLKRGGKGAAAAAVSSVFLPFAFTGKAAAPKTLSFWQFYAPAKQVGIQSKWFEDCVKGWNSLRIFNMASFLFPYLLTASRDLIV